jgi:aminoglycoside phosphotransferase (APT) family kinase protein
VNTSTKRDTLDAERLAAYLAAKVSGFKGPLKLQKFAGGQSNPTFLLESPSGKYVLRRKPPGQVLKSAHAVDREFRVIAALAATEVPVAKAIHLCSDDDVIGSMFYLMSYVPGRTFWDAALPELHPGQRPGIYAAMNRTLSALHSVNVDAIGLGDYGKPGNYFARQISMWTRQYQLSETESIPAMNFMLDWLPANTPPDDGRVCLIHGDFRIDNMIFHPEEAEVSALIDWELSTLGHPMADLAYHCMSLRLPGLSDMKGLGGIDRTELNIPREEDFIARYCERTGLGRIDHWPFYLAFSYFRLAAIVQGVMKRALDGNASSPKALEVGKMARPLAEMAVAVLESDSSARLSS